VILTFLTTTPNPYTEELPPCRLSTIIIHRFRVYYVRFLSSVHNLRERHIVVKPDRIISHMVMCFLISEWYLHMATCTPGKIFPGLHCSMRSEMMRHGSTAREGNKGLNFRKKNRSLLQYKSKYTSIANLPFRQMPTVAPLSVCWVVGARYTEWCKSIGI
jgi:hypothetical protein